MRTFEYCTHCGARNTAEGSICGSCGKDVSVPFAPYSYSNRGTFQFHPPWRFRRPYEKSPKPPTPMCPDCGQPVRVEPDVPDEPGMMWRIMRNAPWNKEWTGACDQCGRLFVFEYATQLHFDVKRQVQIRPMSKEFRVGFGDESVFLSGVEIVVRNQQLGGEIEEQVVFLGTGELVRLIEELQDKPSVLLEQYDWGEDYT